MTLIARLLSLTSGFALMGYHRAPADLIATSIAIDLALAPLTAVVAARRGRSIWRWLVAGVALGAWALGAVLLLPHHRPPPPRDSEFPPTSDAA